MQSVSDGLTDHREELFLHAIARRLQSTPSEELKFCDNGTIFVPVSRDYLDSFVCRNEHKQLGDQLAEREVITFERSVNGNKSYSEGKRPARYAILSPLTLRWVSISSKTGGKLVKVRESGRGTLSESRRPLAECVFSPDLLIDETLALQALQEHYQAEHNKLSLAILRLNAFNAFDRFIRQDTFGGRITSPVSCLNKQARPALRWRGEPLVEIDISASQPTLLQLLGDTDRLWKDLCASGELYDWLADHLKASREGTKERLLRWLFTSLKDTSDKELRLLLQKHFPLITQLRNDLGAHGNKALSEKLQASEAGLTLDSVAVPLLARYPDSCILTIHDSLLTTEDLEEEASALLLSELQKREIKGRVKQIRFRTGEEVLLFT